MYLEVFSKCSKSGRILIGLLDIMFDKGMLTKEELHRACELADDPFKFNDVFNKLVHAAVPEGEAIILGASRGCPLAGHDTPICPYCNPPDSPRLSPEEEGGPI